MTAAGALHARDVHGHFDVPPQLGSGGKQVVMCNVPQRFRCWRRAGTRRAVLKPN